ncbi:unnamed protein product [Acanthoscelides obtectus]|uniref:Uncharacterized protein n=1 Tax=Acanthoscelides obtectus TaxID=200917 RepID=A0A9P0KCZ4_ACAOB|nr:unnamed protein product [Acanthoscelides obtectus]CAK1680235.1 hypothetical protein AOBTE_LOCUS32541 [Acanthoscelides obtectus]
MDNQAIVQSSAVQCHPKLLKTLSSRIFVLIGQLDSLKQVKVLQPRLSTPSSSATVCLPGEPLATELSTHEERQRKSCVKCT